MNRSDITFVKRRWGRGERSRIRTYPVGSRLGRGGGGGDRRKSLSEKIRLLVTGLMGGRGVMGETGPGPYLGGKEGDEILRTVFINQTGGGGKMEKDPTATIFSYKYVEREAGTLREKCLRGFPVLCGRKKKCGAARQHVFLAPGRWRACAIKREKEGKGSYTWRKKHFSSESFTRPLYEARPGNRGGGGKGTGIV